MTEKMRVALFCLLSGLASLALGVFFVWQDLLDPNSAFRMLAVLLCVLGVCCIFAFGREWDGRGRVGRFISELAILLCWFAAAVIAFAIVIVVSSGAAAQQYSGGFTCSDVAGPNGEQVRALTRSDGHLAYFRFRDGAFMRGSGCGSSSAACVEAVRGCFGVEIGLDTPFGEFVIFEPPPVVRVISTGISVWFVFFVIGVALVLLKVIRIFRDDTKAGRW